jgi:Bacteriophage holin family
MLIPVWAKNLGYILAAILGVKYDALFAFGALMIMDVVTGVIASASVNGWRSVTSRRLAFGVLSKLCLLLIPLAVALAALIVGQDMSFLVTSAISILAVSEAYSITGNVYTIKTGKRVPEFDAVSIILSRIREVLIAPVEKGRGEK